MGVIGVGWWGTVGHLEPLSKDEKAEVVAVYSRSEEKARERAEKYGVARYYADYRRMIDECDLDGVSIATTPNVHYEQARYALEHGVHVLMEKPFVLHAAEAQHLASLARERGLLLSVCYPWCFHPWAVEGRQAIREGKLGRILLVNRLFSQRVYDLYRGDVTDMFSGRAVDYPLPNATSYSDPAVVGGGEGHTQATHAIGELLYLTGLAPASVFAYMNSLDVGLDVVDAIVVRFEGGALGTFSANGLVPKNMGAYSAQVLGDRGIFSIDSTRSAGQIWLEGEKPRELERPAHVSTVALVPQNFLRAIRGEEALHVETEVAVNVVKILDAAYRSAASGQEIRVS